MCVRRSTAKLPSCRRHRSVPVGWCSCCWWMAVARCTPAAAAAPATWACSAACPQVLAWHDGCSPGIGGLGPLVWPRLAAAGRGHSQSSPHPTPTSSSRGSTLRQKLGCLLQWGWPRTCCSWRACCSARSRRGQQQQPHWRRRRGKRQLWGQQGGRLLPGGPTWLAAAAASASGSAPQRTAAQAAPRPPAPGCRWRARAGRCWAPRCAAREAACGRCMCRRGTGSAWPLLWTLFSAAAATGGRAGLGGCPRALRTTAWRC